jgi:hypothetical protein
MEGHKWFLERCIQRNCNRLVETKISKLTRSSHLLFQDGVIANLVARSYAVPFLIPQKPLKAWTDAKLTALAMVGRNPMREERN